MSFTTNHYFSTEYYDGIVSRYEQQGNKSKKTFRNECNNNNDDDDNMMDIQLVAQRNML